MNFMKDYKDLILGGIIIISLIAVIGYLFKQSAPLNMSGFRGEAVAPFEALPSTLDDGLGLRFEDLKKDTVMINFFASWCAPCRMEHDTLISLAKDHDITIHGIAFQDSPENIQKYLESFGNPYATVSNATDEIARAWQIVALPETLIVNKDAQIILRVKGPIMDGDVEKHILPFFKKNQTD